MKKISTEQFDFDRDNGTPIDMKFGLGDLLDINVRHWSGGCDARKATIIGIVLEMEDETGAVFRLNPYCSTKPSHYSPAEANP